MERNDRPSIASFFSEVPLRTDEPMRMSDAAAQHVHARRLTAGDPVRLLDGRGRIGWGRLAEVGKRHAIVTLGHVEEVLRPTELEVIVPIADRDRMLLASEKCVELGTTAWRPVLFARSRSVSPRGQGDRFREKVLARMQGALEQSGNAWLPDVHDDNSWSSTVAAVPREWKRLLLDSAGSPMPTQIENAPIAIAVGPEGGLESHEIELAGAAGWRLVSLGRSTLRFETAIIAGVAIIRAAQHSARS